MENTVDVTIGETIGETMGEAIDLLELKKKVDKEMIQRRHEEEKREKEQHQKDLSNVKKYIEHITINDAKNIHKRLMKAIKKGDDYIAIGTIHNRRKGFLWSLSEWKWDTVHSYDIVDIIEEIDKTMSTLIPNTKLYADDCMNPNVELQIKVFDKKKHEENLVYAREEKEYANQMFGTRQKSAEKYNRAQYWKQQELIRTTYHPNNTKKPKHESSSAQQHKKTKT